MDEFIHVGGALVIIIAVVSVLTGFMREFIPQDRLQKKLTQHEKWGSVWGALFGMLTPFCSASVVPVTMGMATMGVSLGTVMSFLISAPLCNFIVLAMVYTAFGLKITASYLGITFVAAVLGGWVISKTPWKDEIKRGGELESKKKQTACAPASSCCAAPVQPSACAPAQGCGELSAGTDSSKVQLAFRFAWALFKKIIPYVLLGSLISGLSAAYLSAEIVEKYVGGDSLLSIVLAAIIGVPVYLRIEMAIPLLKMFIAKGMGLGPAIALIIGGTGASLPEIALVSSVLKPKAVVAFVAIILTTAVVGGVIIQSLY
ncbi:permease [Kiritimatiellota bacterium B12222]|nr:permease [Kiritimatiellota bacterium B12222]